MKAAEAVASADLKAAMEDWIANKDEGEGSRARAEKLVELLEAEKAGKPELEALYENKQFFVKRSQWIFGGDGWAYDIGYGGLDHVLASGDDVNVMVFDTEVTPTPADSPPSPLLKLLLLSLPLPVNGPRRRIWA